MKAYANEFLCPILFSEVLARNANRIFQKGKRQNQQGIVLQGEDPALAGCTPAASRDSKADSLSTLYRRRLIKQGSIDVRNS